jgi:uncharacterized membrane protein YbhN (UPF0104 family)
VRAQHKKQGLKALLQAAISVALLAFVAWQIDIGQAVAVFTAGTTPAWLFAAWLAFNLSKVIGAFRLNGYQRAAGIQIAPLRNLRIYYAGMFLNHFLPGGVGGDGYKILLLQRQLDVPWRRLLVAILADRISGVLVLGIMLALLLTRIDIPWYPAWVQGSAIVVAIAGVLVFVLGHRLLEGFDARRLLAVFALGIGVQGLQMLCVVAILAYLGSPPMQLLPILAAFLLSSIAAVLPLSLGGLGVREVTLLYSLQWLGLEPTFGVVAATAFYLVALSASLIGALFLEPIPRRASAT